MNDDLENLKREIQAHRDEALNQQRDFYEQRLAHIRKLYDDATQRHEERSEQAHKLIQECQSNSLKLRRQLDEALAAKEQLVLESACLSVQLEQSQLMYRQLLDVVRSMAENSCKDFPVYPQDS